MKTKTLLLIFALLTIMAKAQVGYIHTIAGTGVAGYSGDGGQATSAKLGITFGAVVDAAGNVIFSDNGNNAIRKINQTTGIITKVAGTYYNYNGTNWYYGGDGGLATDAYMAYPFAVAMDTAGNIYVADNLNNVIRKITVSTGIITTVAGDGSIFYNVWPFCGDGGLATDAQLNDPWGVAVDIAGNIYIADRGNNVIRKVDVSTGIINTVAGTGTGGYTGDNGPATSATLNGPDGITLDSQGNMYISDDYNNVIRKVSKATGIITTIAGNGTAGYSGDNGPATSAKLNDPSIGIAFDPQGNFYIADDGNNVIRKVTVSTGIITTVAGNGVQGYSGDNGPATSATLNGPEGVAVDALGNIYILDENNVVRKVNGPGGSIPATPGTIQGNTPVCSGSVNTYSITAVAGATSYTWTLPSGWTGTSTTTSIVATAGNSGTISVTANNLFGSSTAQTLNVVVTTVNTAVTQASATLTASASGAGYVWVDCGNNYTPIAGQTAQSFTATISGSYAVIVTQSGCVDTSACYSVYINGAPAMPGTISGTESVCPGTSVTFSITPVNGATSYTWTLPNGWTGSSTTNSINATVNSSGTISVTANNSYGSSTAQTLFVTVITVNTAVTQVGSTLTSGANGAIYQWIDCSGYDLLAGQTYQCFTATAPGDYAVIVTQDGCLDTSACYTIGSGCGITITGADLPYDGLGVILAVDSIHNVSIASGVSQTWDYSALVMQYPKYADYHATSTTPYATVFPYSNIYTYGPGNLYGSLYGGAPVGPGNGYCFWRSDSTGFWVTGFRPESGIFAGVNVQNTPQELVIGAPSSYGSQFTAYGRWELPFNRNAADVDTFYVRTIKKQIVADACGSLTTPHGTYPNVLRQHEYITEIDSVYGRMYGYQVYATEYARDSSNTYTYLAHNIGYPVCTVHCDKHNVVQNVEYYNGTYSGIINNTEPESQFSVYPNPSEGKVTIEISNESNNAANQIYIYNSVGSMVWQKTSSDKMIDIDLSDFSKGIYLVTIINNKKISSKKIVID